MIGGQLAALVMSVIELSGTRSNGVIYSRLFQMQ